MIGSIFGVKRGSSLQKATLIGEVVDNQDPKGSNRVKVKLYGYTDILSRSQLPFYSLKTEVSDSPNANIRVPSIGSIVEVEVFDDILNGVVISTLPNPAPK
jgi:hypothetical protein